MMSVSRRHWDLARRRRENAGRYSRGPGTSCARRHIAAGRSAVGPLLYKSLQCMTLVSDYSMTCSPLIIHTLTLTLYRQRLLNFEILSYLTVYIIVSYRPLISSLLTVETVGPRHVLLVLVFFCQSVH